MTNKNTNNRLKSEVKESVGYSLYKLDGRVIVTNSTLKRNIIETISNKLYKSLTSVDGRNPKRLYITDVEISDVNYETEDEQLQFIIFVNYVYNSPIPFVYKNEEKTFLIETPADYLHVKETVNADKEDVIIIADKCNGC